MDRTVARQVGAFAVAGLAAGVLADVVWWQAASAERHCYTSINLQFFTFGGAYTDGTCYDLGSRRTKANIAIVAGTVLVAAIAAWLARRVVAGPRRAVAVPAATALAGLAAFALVSVVPFRTLPTPGLAPPWWPAPVTAPVWVPPLLLALLFAIAALVADPGRWLLGVAAALIVVVGALAVVEPLGVAWQRHTDPTVCPEAGRQPDDVVPTVWC